ncbi:MAG: PDDEXK nuclease domain-containing protein [Verrucomicrobiae bacterium]|nr:PDDEXK nuclease domain-containing protein [Verrucomicrobiae bacterium]
MNTQKTNLLYQRIRRILESARTSVSRSVNTTQVVANWLVGREIVEEEQQGRIRAEYGKQIIEELAERLQAEFGNGYAALNLWFFRRFYVQYPELVVPQKVYAPRQKLEGHRLPQIGHAPCDQLSDAASIPSTAILYAPRKESWRPGWLHPNLSWTHYRTLLKADESNKRAFYEIEAIQNNWSSRELERQINSLLYERLALSRDKKGLMRLAVKGHEVQKPTDVFKDPVVVEFLGLPESPKLVETKLEQALINNLQSFLLELGKGFAFIARQERLTLDGDHFYIDLVFYHTILKCYVIIDLKTGKLTHQDLGQLQLYVNYYDRERRTKGDNPTLGLILCADKNDAVVRYTLGVDQQKTIFASRYKLHLPSVAELQAELRREVRALAVPIEKNRQDAKGEEK